MIKLGLLLLIGAGLLACGAQKSQPSQQKTADLERIYVDSFDCSERVSQGETLEVKVQGNLPSPAYRFKEFGVQVGDGKIEITPLATYDSDKIVAQMLVPFEQTCRVENLRPGAYEVTVIGRGRAPVSKQTVQVK